MKKIILSLPLLMLNMIGFSQNVMVKKEYLQHIVEDLRTKDVLSEKVVLQKALIDTLTVQNGLLRQQSSQNAQYYQSCMTELGKWRVIAENNEKLYKADRAKKRKKGWVNVLLTAALGGVTYLYITK